MSNGPAGHVARSTVRPHSETTRRTPLRTFLHTDDGVTIDSVYDPGAVVYDASRPPAGDLAFVVAHGFTGDADKPHVRRVAEAFTRHGAVVTFSFRGHGASGGRSTVGDREVLDLAAAVRWARELGHARVATVGFSMGGSVVLRHAALYRRPDGSGREEREGGAGAHTDAVVSVSAPARWYYRGTAPMRKLHWLVTRPEGRLVGRYGFRTRIHHREWDPVPMSPVEAAALIAPTPLLIVHGDRDGYFPLDHPRMLAGAAGDHGELWLEQGMGHAEHAAADELLGRIGDWAVGGAG
ncbi:MULTISPECIES: alpha/beta fold hydrolase [unclassified Streptomyces]|uniref:alpha/beta hydrolase n=1 Tax=unclassified Streptomyces TaxID=2593676 RepID=UPI0023651EAA|nr:MULTISPECIES: alpha/beta fold hydrolase [unclassified Streptomyces]MDF3145027.1 alpha/beta fold hydrolase [Streptomyces sp. T21Q-yed]WDF39289.1 alpha/beta fold hydrolase [Streptomyces sp. T12]